MIVITPETENYKSIFLAGTIDNGDSIDWQKKLIEKFKDTDFKIYNPRRKNWNKSASKEELEYQIKWEQEHLDNANLIVMVLSDNSKSPISLLELGLYATSKKILVFCTDKFYRFDNVRLTCEKYNIPLFTKTDINYIFNKIIEKINNDEEPKEFC